MLSQSQPLPTLVHMESNNQSQPTGNFVTTTVDSNNKLVDLSAQYSDHRKRKRNRPTVSCLNCKRKKVKCDRMRPMCGACLRNHMPDGSCVYISNIEERKKKTIKVESPSPSTVEALHLSKTTTTTIRKRRRVSSPETYQESNRVESLLDEIDRLKSIIFQGASGWLSPDMKPGTRAKDIHILRGIRKAHLRSLSHISDRCLRIDELNYSTFLGPSNFRSFIMYDPNMGKLMHKFKNQLHQERSEWKQSLKPNQYREMMRRKIETLSLATYSGGVGRHTVMAGTPHQQALICTLEDYLMNYDTFMKVLKNSLDMMHGLLPIIPHKLMDSILHRHFRRLPGSSRIKILYTGQPIDFAEIALVISALKFGILEVDEDLANSDFKSMADGSTTSFNLATENETNLLYFFGSNLIEEAEYRTFCSLPTLLSLVTLYFIASRNVEKYDLATLENIPSFQSMTVQMAISLGFHKDISEARTPSGCYEMNSPPPTNMIRNLSTDEWRSIWCAVVYMDTMGSFNLGIPSMLGYSADKCYGTGFFNPKVRYVIGAYRTVVRIITSSSPRGKKSNSQVTLFQLEKLINGIEQYNNDEMESFGDLVAQIQKLDRLKDVSEILFMILVKLRLCSLLLFLYIYTHVVFRDSNTELIKGGRLFGKSLEEVKELDSRLFKRALRFSVIMLALLNRLLLNHMRKELSALGIFSTDVSGVFIRCIYALCSHVLNSIEKHNYDNNVTLRIDDFDQHTLDILLNPKNRESPDKNASSTFNKAIDRIDQFFDHPASLLHYLNGFYFNSSRSSIARDYNFFASYKYLFLCFNYMKNHQMTIDTLDCTKFLEEFSNIDSSWFCNN